MAGVYFGLTTGAVSLSAATAKTVMQIVAPTNQRVLIHALRISFTGLVVTDSPINWQVVQQTGAGAGGTTITPRKENNGDNETVQATAQGGLTTEPTTDDAVVSEGRCHPQDREVIYFEPPLPVIGGQRLGVKCNAPQANTVLVHARCSE